VHGVQCTAKHARRRRSASSDPVNTYIQPRDAFLDEDVVAAYRFRPPYPDEIIDRLAALSGPGAAVIDLGCGTGDIARRLAPHVRHLHGVDPSAAMLAAAAALPGGDAGNVTWHRSTAEAFAYPPCSLIVAAESIHWMDLDAVFEAARAALGSGGVFAVAGREYESPWGADLARLIPEFSATRDFVPFDVASLSGPGRIAVEEVLTTPWSVRRQPLDDYIELQHSSAGCARHRMGSARARQFDDALRAVLAPHVTGGSVEYKTAATLRWGRLQAEPRDTL
jgi:SAM-dependent methyltransferase